MTDSQSNYFFYLLTGDTGDHLSNPLPVIRWMEKEMPEVWEAYLVWTIPIFIGTKFTAIINGIFDLSNLITYLSDHREWGKKECRVCEGTGQIYSLVQTEPGACKAETHKCGYCNGSGIIKHPALKYMEATDEQG